MGMKQVLLQVGLVAFSLSVVAGCSTNSSQRDSGASATSSAAAPASSVPEQAATQPMKANPPHHVAQEPVAPASTANGPDAMRATPCTARDVVLKPDGDNGDFNGMSHSGTYLTLTNKSRSACSVPGVPQLTFLDANGPVKADADLPGAKFMHPGPVVLPMVLQPKQSVTTSARWVSGPVYQDNLCYKLTGVSLALRDGGAHTALMGQMCGERSKGVRYELQRYGADAK